MSFTIDGTTWDIPCNIEREAEMTPSDISGLMLNKVYFNDVIGTYMRYTISIAVPFGMESEYASLYEVLTDPKSHHTMVLPYNGSTITISARIEVVSDAYVRKPGGGNYWRDTKFTAISCAPSKTYTQSQASSAGLPALPDVENPSEGSTYTYTNGEWEVTDYDDADGTRY